MELGHKVCQLSFNHSSMYIDLRYDIDRSNIVNWADIDEIYLRSDISRPGRDKCYIIINWLR